jgi:hypothetical protein
MLSLKTFSSSRDESFNDAGAKTISVLKKTMKTVWFKRWGWVYRPVAWQGFIIVVTALAFCAQVFCAVDRKSHSASDTLYGVFPFFVCSFLLLDWIAARTSHDPNHSGT